MLAEHVEDDTFFTWAVEHDKLYYKAFKSYQKILEKDGQPDEEMSSEVDAETGEDMVVLDEEVEELTCKKRRYRRLFAVLTAAMFSACNVSTALAMPLQELTEDYQDFNTKLVEESRPKDIGSDAFSEWVFYIFGRRNSVGLVLRCYGG